MTKATTKPKTTRKRRTTKKEQTSAQIANEPLQSANDQTIGRCREMIRAKQAQMNNKWGKGYENQLGEEDRGKFINAWGWFEMALQCKRADLVKDYADQLMRGFPVVEKQLGAAGQRPRPPDLWELTLDGGMPVLFAKTEEDRQRAPDGAVVFLASEIITLLDSLPVVIQAKETWTKAEVTKATPFNDDIPF